MIPKVTQKGFITNSNETADEENAVKPSSDVLSDSVVESRESLLHFVTPEGATEQSLQKINASYYKPFVAPTPLTEKARRELSFIRKISFSLQKDFSRACLGTDHREDPKLVTNMIKNGAQIDAKRASGATLLMEASARTRLATVKVLLECGADPNACTIRGITALMMVAEVEPPGMIMGYHYEIIEGLLAYHADVNKRSITNWTALHSACLLGNLRVIKILLNAGADISVRESIFGDTPLEVLNRYGHRSTLVALNSYASFEYSESRTVSGEQLTRDIKLTDYFTDKSEPDIYKRTRGGATSLMGAASSGNLEKVKYLVDKGADVNAMARNGDTALLLALENKHLAIAQLLLENKASVRVATVFGYTPLHLSIHEKYLRLALGMIDQSDIRAKTCNGLTALHIACREGYLTIAMRLIEKGDEKNGAEKIGNDVNSLTSELETPLHLVADAFSPSWQAVEIAQLLIKHGANLDAKTVSSKTALDLANEKQNGEIASYLRSVKKNL